MNQKKYQTPSLGCEPIRSQAILITNGLLFTFCMPKNIINNIRKQFDGVKASKLVTLSTCKKSKICLFLWYLRKTIGELNEAKKNIKHHFWGLNPSDPERSRSLMGFFLLSVFQKTLSSTFQNNLME